MHLSLLAFFPFDTENTTHSNTPFGLFFSKRYEIKFLVDGEWQLSPELPTVGEGSLKNNLLIV